MKIIKMVFVAAALLSSTYANAGKVDSEKEATQLLGKVFGTEGVINLTRGYNDKYSANILRPGCGKNDCTVYDFDKEINGTSMRVKYDKHTQELDIIGTMRIKGSDGKFAEFTAKDLALTYLDPETNKEIYRGNAFLTVWKVTGKAKIYSKPAGINKTYTLAGNDFILGIRPDSDGKGFSVHVGGFLGENLKFNAEGNARNGGNGTVSEPAAGLAFLGALGLLAFGARRRALQS